jgi:hypothetical protein
MGVVREVINPEQKFNQRYIVDTEGGELDVANEEIIADPERYAGQSGPFCGCCGEPCSTKTIDEGIGSYEYWGAKGVDSRKANVSQCCEAELFNDPYLTTSYEFSEPDYEEDFDIPPKY